MKKKSPQTTSIDAENKVWIQLANSRADAGESSKQISDLVREKLTTLSLRCHGGDGEALLEYFRLTHNAAMEWDVMWHFQFEKVRNLARKCSTWPVLTSLHPDNRERVWRRLEQLELGRDLPGRIPDKKRPWKASGANLKVITSLQMLEAVRTPGFLPGPPTEEWMHAAIALPPLSPETWEDWFRVMWDMICAKHAGHPEYNKSLCRLGRHRENASVRKHQQKRATPRTMDSNIKDGIRESLRLAFKRLVKTSPTIKAPK